MTSETLPDGLAQNLTLNQIGEPVGLEYVKTRGCTSACTWYTDTITPSIEGRWRTQTSSLAKDNYVYDGLGRISGVQETAGPKHACTARLYTYDADSDRTGLTIRPSKSKKCPTGTSQGRNRGNAPLRRSRPAHRHGRDVQSVRRHLRTARQRRWRLRTDEHVLHRQPAPKRHPARNPRRDQARNHNQARREHRL